MGTCWTVAMQLNIQKKKKRNVIEQFTPPPPSCYLGLSEQFRSPQNSLLSENKHTTKTERSAHKAVKSTLVMSKQNRAAPEEEKIALWLSLTIYCFSSTEVR